MESNRVCIGTDCERPVSAKNMCHGHYTRARVHGDPRIDVPLGVHRYPVAPGVCAECGVTYEKRLARQQVCSRPCRTSMENKKKRPDASVKRCRTCQGDLPVERYEIAHWSCRECEGLFATEHKRCAVCTRVKPFTDFHRRPGRDHGYASDCKDCNSAKSRHRNAAPEKRLKNKANKWATRFGMTADQYEAMKAAQGGLCAICGEVPAKTLCVDHCHETNQVRQLLCGPCNSLLGFARENQSILRSAIDYLGRHSNEFSSIRP